MTHKGIVIREVKGGFITMNLPNNIKHNNLQQLKEIVEQEVEDIFLTFLGYNLEGDYLTHPDMLESLVYEEQDVLNDWNWLVQIIQELEHVFCSPNQVSYIDSACDFLYLTSKCKIAMSTDFEGNLSDALQLILQFNQ